MKYIAFIVLGLVLLAAIGGIVLWANMPTAKLTVHAVRSMGTNTDSDGWPFWDIAITNAGRVRASCDLKLFLKYDDGSVAFYDASSTAPFGPWFLPPNSCTNLQMSMPLNPLGPTAAGVIYSTPQSAVEAKLASWLTGFPKLRRRLPNQTPHFAQDSWHSGTNVATAH